MTPFRLIVVAACLAFAASTHAQDKEVPKPPAADKVEERQAAEKPGPKPVIEITWSTRAACDVKPVMTDEEIARCKKAR